jgi:hypothetical protein
MRRWRTAENEKFKLSKNPLLPAKIFPLFIIAADLSGLNVTYRDLAFPFGPHGSLN